MALDRVLHGNQPCRKLGEPAAYDDRCTGCMSFHWPAFCDVFSGLPLKDASDCPGYLAKPRPEPVILWTDGPGEGRAA